MTETNAEKFFNSSKTKELVNLLLSSLGESQNAFTTTKPPLTDRSEKYQSYLNDLYALRGRNLFYPYVGGGFGKGPFVELDDGSVKIDLINGIGIHLFGHSHPEIIRASLLASMQDVVMQGNLQPNKEYGTLLEMLLQAAGRTSRLKRGWIGTCGTIVNENALKIARQKNSPARKILAMENAFAGRSTLMAEVTDNPEYKVGLPDYHEVLRIPFYDKNNPHSTENAVAKLKQLIEENPKNISCFVFELLQGEGGFNYAPPEYFKSLFEVCKIHHIAIWADEIQTFSRTGELFAFEKLGLGSYIDIVTLAKTAQCGAVLYTDEYNPKPGLIAGTFTASTVSLAAGIQSLKMLLNDNEGSKIFGAGGKIEKIHNEFLDMLNDLKKGSCNGLIQEFGGLGLMVSMTPFDGSKEKVNKLLQTLFKNGLIAFSCGHGPYKIRFLLPLVLESDHIIQVKKILEMSLLQEARN
jgi:4-aminobutyrate aminotransferase-like enzyme